MATIKQKDNSNTWLKAALRRKFLPKDARVLDLFCGTGEMYNRVYKDKTRSYHGVDKAKTHDQTLCTLIDNTVYVSRHNMDEYNVFDLDDYGCPWGLLYLVLRKRGPGRITVFLTDGLPLHLKLTGKVTKMQSGIEKLPKDMNIPGGYRFYLDMFGTMLLDLETRYGWKTENATYARNENATVYYWALNMNKGGLTK